MKFCPRNAVELRNVLLLISDYYNSETLENYKILYDIGVEESATLSEWCRFTGEDVGWSHEICDDDIPRLMEELDGQIARSQTFFGENCAGTSDEDFELHIKLVTFCALIIRTCMDRPNDAEGPTDNRVEQVDIPSVNPVEFNPSSVSKRDSFAGISRDVLDCDEAAFAAMTFEKQMEFQIERNRVENERRAS